MCNDYYDLNAQTFFDKTINVDMGNIYQRFLPLLKQGGCILDAGCGSGRDAKYFKDQGFQVDAFDASQELASLASDYSGLPVKTMKFSDVDQVEIYDGLWCCASLLHTPESELIHTMNKLALSLKTDGIWYLSFKYGDTEREVDGRRFTDFNEKKLHQLIDVLTLVSLEDCWITSDNRPDHSEQWLNAILKR